MKFFSKFLACLIIKLVVVECVNAKSVTVCENEEAHLQCFPGEMIVVENIFYGRKDNTTCSPHWSLVNWQRECSSATAFQVVSNTCLHQSSCRIHATNGLFSDPCPNVFKFFVADYKCIDVTKKSASVCEDGVANLQCRRGEMIDVVNVFYGRRDKTTCTPHWSIGNWESTCYSVNALQLVSARCNNLESCSVPASNQLFSDPCPLVYKYLVVVYHCIQTPVQLLTTCEHGELELICPQSKVIQVKSVFYGRKERVTCTPHWSIPNWKSECYSATALSIVSTMCNNLRTCKVPASNNLFSDPCPMVFKYLEIEYVCVA